ncbi:MAG: activator of (R)-2-hydroxyglutaryl-CoA dehydratase [Planctomycetota bacterium]
MLREAGLEGPRHFLRPVERPFTADQRGTTTLLFGGLTIKHERLILGALEGLGYTCEMLPVPDVRSFQIGKEYGNNGQCNPTYFTVGNLVKHLQKLRDSGVSKERILSDHVFFTAGACGPCRFGMYEAEYRLALRNAGFDGFRVLLFQQEGGLDQSQVEAGLEMDLNFFLSIVASLNIGDLVNEVGYQIRPFEVEEGATNRALERCMDVLEEAMRTRTFPERTLAKFLSQLLTRHYTRALEEGDGNFNMFRFLQAEGAEVMAEPVATWLMYLLWQVKQGMRDRFGLKGDRNPFKHYFALARLALAERLFLREYERCRKALGGTAHRPVNIHYHNQKLCHMVLSLKPFGCMPSTQSDGAQAAVISRYSDMIYLPIETSGEGEINAHSRVQMALGEARRKAREEFAAALAATGRTVDEIRAYVAEHPALRSALCQVPKDKRYAGTAANYVTHVAELMS